MTLKNAIKKIKAYELGVAHSLASRSTNDFRNRILKPYGLSSIEWMVLGIVEDKTRQGGIRVTDLANTLNVKTTYITATLNTLKRKNHVDTKSDSHDARVRKVVTTKKGSQTVDTISGLLRQNVEETLHDRVTGEQFEHYVHVLKEIAAAKATD